ncbi:MAG TPA: M1 family aminopeptidase [Thermoanaerobaculia bacterium]|nr:M1 family aminopeptidase [Thermoanaerobaculia bacterium]
MNPSRIATIARLELWTYLTGPLFWFLLLLVAFVALSLNPIPMMPSGDATIGGVRPFINSPHALAPFFSLGAFLLYTFFVPLLAGPAVIRDDEAKITDLLHSTPLSPAEYITGKFAGAVASFGLVLAFHLALTIWNHQLAPVPNPEALRGPFQLGTFVASMLLFAAPGVLFCAGLAFAVGEWTRKPMAVYAVPIVLFLSVLVFLWPWSPPGLHPAINQFLMIVEPSGLRWLSETAFKVDRGVAFYNHAPLPFDATFWLGRLFTLAVPLLAVAASVRHRRATIAGKRAARKSPARSGAVTEGETLSFRSLRDLRMTSAPPGFLASTMRMVRSEIEELSGQPVLYLLIPFAMLLVVESAETETDSLGGAVLQTAGGLAVGTLEMITTLVCLLLMFQTVESVQRDRGAGFALIFYSAPFRTGAMLLAKGLAGAVLAAVILLGSAAASLAVLALQGRGRVEVWPFLVVWGLLLPPTFFAWSAFVTAVLAIVRERYATYAVGLGALLLTVYGFLSGRMTWVSNWPLWGALRWSDMGAFDLNAGALLLNRLLVASAGVFFAALAIRFFPRTESDATGTLHRLRPRNVFRSALRLAPFALPPLLAGGWLAHQVDNGFQSEAAQGQARAYWRRNVATWDGVTPPALTHMDLKVALEPRLRTATVAGTFTMVNRAAEPMGLLPFTVRPSFRGLAWTLDGAAAEPEDRSGLHVLQPAAPLRPGQEVRVGFSYQARYPEGMTRNGGGAAQFVLPSGVVLHTLRDDFLPVPGFVGSLGWAGEDSPEPRSYPDDFWKARLAPISGQEDAFTTRIEVTAPSEYTVNSVGEKTAESARGGRTTVVWESGAPVRAVNIVAGRWAVRRRDGAAVFHHPGHPYNVEEMLNALAAARARFSEWFHPYPWRELRLSQFPNQASNAQGFPSNLSFSESSGFLSKGAGGAAFVVTAHEAAHQWWGNLLTPGEGPGADVLIEGMAHYSALLLVEAELGLQGRMDLARSFESSYGKRRRVDSELPLVKTQDNGRDSDETVIYDKGAWVMWMLHNHLGRDRMLAGLQAFFRAWHASPDHPSLQDLIAALRPYAADPAAYQAFVEQWFFGVVLPEYRVSDAEAVPAGGAWRISATIENVGTGVASVELAAVRGGHPDGKRTAVTLAPGRPLRVSWTAGFRPERIVVDPDVLVLQLNRGRAAARF